MPSENNNANQILINGEEVINLRSDTVSSENLLQGETAHNKAGEQITGDLDPATKDDAYLVSDIEDDIADDDYIPFNDVSDPDIIKKKTLFSSIVTKIKTAFNSVFASITGNNITDKKTFRENIQTIEFLGVDIPDNADLDTYTTAGNYRVVSDASGETIDNLPLALCGKVVVFNNGNGGIEQFYFANHSPRIFVRTKFGTDAWTTWKELGEGGDSKAHSYELGTEILANADLDNYTTVGSYYIKFDTDAQTIDNVPVECAGKLIVLETTDASANYLMQVYIKRNSYDIYIRYYNKNTSTWNEWQNNTHSYRLGIEIPANADLNTYTTEGVYQCELTATARTMSNLPYIGNQRIAFKLIVSEIRNSNNIMQTWISYQNNSMAYRTSNDNGATWNTWTSIYSAIDNTIHGLNVKTGSWWSQFKYFINGDKRLRVNHSLDNGVTWNGDQTLAYLDDLKTHTYEVGTLVKANDDLNDYTDEGSYTIHDDSVAQTVANIPTVTQGKLVVYRVNNGTNKAQLFISSIAHEIYERVRYSNGNWSTWAKVATTDDISPSTVGDGYAIATVSGSAISATITGYQLRAGVIVVLRFNTEITSACTLNINSTGAKSVKTWADEDITLGHPIFLGVHAFIYDGTYYRKIASDRVPSVTQQSYVADTSGNILIDWGYGVNRTQIKNNIGTGKLSWNYYKNGAWRGDVELIDTKANQSLSGWLKLKDNGGRTIASGAHSLNVSDTIPNVLNELRYSNGAWGSFNLGTAYTLNGITIPTGWYNYFYIPHRVGGENWATPTTWEADNVNYGNLLLFGMNNTNGAYKVRYSSSSVVEVNVLGLDGKSSYGTCSTAGDQQIKVVTIPNFVLVVGGIIGVKFTNTNTYVATADNKVQLNVNNTGAKPIYAWNNNPTGNNTTAFGIANYIHYYMYDGANWCFISHSGDNDTNDHINSKGNVTAETGTTRPAVTGLSMKQAYNNGYPQSYGNVMTMRGAGDTELFQAWSGTSGKAEPLYFRSKRDNSSANWSNWDMIYSNLYPNVFYCTCTTNSSDRNKIALSQYGSIISLKAGMIIGVKFTNTNTYSNATSNPITLNFNSTGAKYIWYAGTHSGAGNTGTNTIAYGRANYINFYMYDGTYWIWLSSSGDIIENSLIVAHHNWTKSLTCQSNGIHFFVIMGGLLRIVWISQSSNVGVYDGIGNLIAQGTNNTATEGGITYTRNGTNLTITRTDESTISIIGIR